MIKNPKKFIGILIILSAIFFLLDKAHKFEAIFSFGEQSLVGPTLQAGQNILNGSVSLFESFFLVRSFLAENEETLKARDFYRGEYFKLLAVKEENKFLRDNLGFGASGGKLVLASLINFDPLRPSQFLTIDKGTSDGIKEGQAVILAGRILVGKVGKVNKNTSQIILITSEGSRVASIIEHSGSSAIVVGSASNALILDLVLQNAELQLGEIVLSSGLGSDIPKNLLIGEVTKIISKDSSPFKKAVLNPFFSFNRLNQLFVISK